MSNPGSTRGRAVRAAVSLAADKDDTAKVLEKYKPNIDKGLKWLAEHQEKDGHWEGPRGKDTVQRTALAGLALLAEDSTTKDGKYTEQLRKAVEWLTAHAGDDGRFFDGKDQFGSKQYMAGHGFALLFLGQVYATETDEKRKKEIGKVLDKAGGLRPEGADQQRRLGLRDRQGRR